MSSALPSVPAANAGTIGGAISIVCGTLAILIPAILKYTKERREAQYADERNKRAYHLRELEIERDERVRRLEEQGKADAEARKTLELRLREIDRKADATDRKADANTETGAANTARTAALGGLYNGTIRQLQDSGVLATPESVAAPQAGWPGLLLVEDNPDAARAMTELLAFHKFRVTHAATVAEAIALLDESPALVVLDLHLPDGDGTDVLRAVRAAGLGVRVVVTTAESVASALARLGSLSPDAIFQKPVNLDALIAALKGA